MTASRPFVAIVGGGPAGLMAAETVAASGARVTVYDRMPSIGRKLLMAGRGGLNLTHSEPLDRLLDRYADTPSLRAAVEAFPPERLRAWCADLGQETFVGSSGRVFPTVMKASPLLRAWLRRLDASGVQFALRHRWTGWTDSGALRFDNRGAVELVEPDATVLACGGASWSHLGSDGSWAGPVWEAGLPMVAFEPANCGFVVDWSPAFRDRFEGTPLKNVGLRFGNGTARGDVMITRTGLEGGALYALSAPLRKAVTRDGAATLDIALRPDMSADAIARRIETGRPKQSRSTMLRKTLNLPPVAIALMRETLPQTGDGPQRAAPAINDLPIRLIGVAPIARAISTAGGLAFSAVDHRFMVRERPGLFAAGEMLDWEAPTGGYLLQACMASGAAAGRGAAAWLGLPQG